MRNILVAHPGKQHSYRLAAALKKSGMLRKYITTVYWKPKRILYKLLGIMLRGSTDEVRMTTRRCFELEDNDIKQFYELGGLIVLLLLRIDRSGKLYRWYNSLLQGRFSLKVAKYAAKQKVDGVVMYDTSALKCFKWLERHPGIVRVQDVSIAARNFTAEICREDMKKAGVFAATYSKYSYIDNPQMMEQVAEEIRLTDHFLVPSTFVKKSLEFNGISQEWIHVVPYGVDLAQFKPYKQEYREGNTINFLFAGSIEQRKGIGYLLEAFKQLDNPHARLLLAGGFIGENALYEPYRKWFTYLGHYPTNRIQEAYSQADIFVFPSIWEGFGLVILEAMACGLPVICSDHTAGSDIVEDGIDGFVVPAGDLKALKEKIQFFIDNPEEVRQMGKNARTKAEQNSWERYDCRVAEVLKEIVVQGKR